jgi:hypothetical protein
MKGVVGMEILYEIEKGIIVIVGLLMAYAEFSQAIRYRRSWVKWGLGVMGVYWAAYYTYSFIRSIYGSRLEMHQIFVRSGILVTIALVTSGALMTLRELKRLRK